MKRRFIGALAAALFLACVSVQTAARRITKWHGWGFCAPDTPMKKPAPAALEIIERFLIEYQDCGVLQPVVWSEIGDTVAVVVDPRVRIPEGGVPRFVRATNVAQAKKLTPRGWLTFTALGSMVDSDGRPFHRIQVIESWSPVYSSTDMCVEETKGGFTMIPLGGVTRISKPCRPEDADRFPKDVPLPVLPEPRPSK